MPSNRHLRYPAIRDLTTKNANPRDDHDHPDGVWSLPPTLRGGAKGREGFIAIGESDRMTLKFQKTD